MPARKKSGFTLIELLVVIAIIAILAAILFPVFARAREAARKSTCASNMKELAIALQTYWTDYDATLPSSSAAGNFTTFAAALGEIPPPQGTVPRTWAQILYGAMKNKDIMFCPSDGADHNPMANHYDYTRSPVSYYWKKAIDRAWDPLWQNQHPTWNCRKEGDFGYNADQIVFYERAGFHSGNSQGIKNDVKINVVYLDTHVRNVSVVNSTQPSNSTTYITNPEDLGEPCYFNFDNRIAKRISNPPAAGDNPPPAGTPTTYYDPRDFSDMLP